MVMTRVMAFVSATILVTAFAARPAAAQSVKDTYRFIDVGAGAAAGNRTMSGLAPTMGLAFGVTNERHGVQFEFSASGSHTTNRGPFPYMYTFPSSQTRQLGHFYEDSEE